MTDKERLLNEFISLVSIDSPSFGERKMAEHIRSLFAEMGIELEEDDAGSHYGGNAGNLHGFLKGSIEGGPVLFSAHMDTVEPGKGKKAVISGNKITSAGDTVLGADDCAGIAEIAEAIRYITENNIPHRDIELLFTIGEEAFIKGSDAFDFSKIRSEYGYVLDLSGDAGIAALSAPSLISFEITVKGRSAHAGFEPENGINAVAAAALAVSELRQGHIDDISTLNIGMLSGGSAVNIVPDKCVIKGEIRSLKHERALELIENVRKSFDDACKKYGAGYDIRHSIDLTAYSADREGRAVKHFERACGALDIETRYISTFGGSDNNNIAKNGIDAVVISCGMQNVHSCDEYINISELVRCTEIVIRLMTAK